MKKLGRTCLRVLLLAVALAVPAHAAEETADFAEIEVLSETETSVTEQWQSKIDKGTLTIRISSEVVLNEDFTLPNGVNLYIRPKGTLIIPAGVTLTLEGNFSTLVEGTVLVEDGGELICGSGIYVQEKGSVTVKQGGSLLICDSELNCGPTASVSIAGSYAIVGDKEYHVFSQYQNGARSNITGISQKRQGICFAIYDRQDLEYAMDVMAGSHYAMYILEIRGSVALPGGLVLPENGKISIMTADGCLSIPENIEMENNGLICIYDNSALENSGSLANNGELWVYGKLSNNGNLALNAGSYTNVDGTVINNASAYAHESSSLELKGTWEGNAPAAMEPEHIHEYTEAVTAPTCTEQGYTTYTCQCGEFYVSNYVDALGHDYDDGTVVQKPDCVTEGLIRYTCRNDDTHAYSQLVPATGHTFVDNICTACGLKNGTEEDPAFVLGDVNGDGKINAKDATLILQHAVGVLKDDADFNTQAADVSGDGKLNAKDATMILQYSVDIRDELTAVK